MNCTWTIDKTFAGDDQYINDCCVGGDLVLNELKSELSERIGGKESDVAIYQEDWGWALELPHGDIVYSIGLNNNYDGGDKNDFAVTLEATRKVKGLFFSKRVEALPELKAWAEILTELAVERGFEVSLLD